MSKSFREIDFAKPVKFSKFFSHLFMILRLCDGISNGFVQKLKFKM